MLRSLTISLCWWLFCLCAQTQTQAQTIPATVTYTIADDWGAGFVANLSIRNDGITAIQNWVLEFDQPITSFTNVWNCVQGTHVGNKKVLRYESYNATIAPGATVSFGFQATPGALPAAQNYRINGLPLGAAMPSLSVADVSLPEGTGGSSLANFQVTLSPAGTQTVTVTYATADGTATAPADYTATTGTLTFAPGETSKSIAVAVIPDSTEEPTETFSLTLSSPTVATLAKATATATLTNDDIVPRVTVGPAAAYEGDTTATLLSFPLTLSAAMNMPVSVKVSTVAGSATAGVDFTPITNQTVTFAVGETTRSVGVSILSDLVEELTETFTLELSQPTAPLLLGTPNAALGTISDNDGTSHGRPATGLFNYAEVLQKSLFFYECQRSGPLPVSTRVTWRGPSGLTDGDSVAGRSLTGGWYDAGDHVKFGLPMAASATLLAWGAVEYPQGYQQTGQMTYLQDNLRWACDYFLKCHVRDAAGATLEFYGQVGNGNADHGYWGPSETMTMARPAYKVTRTAPGSDLCGETAATLAASSMVFQATDPTYAALLLTHARALYTFADTYRGKYSDAITDATAFYNSWSGYQDELLWGALWLYRATGETSFLTKAQSLFTSQYGTNPTMRWTHAWDDKIYGSVVLLAMLTPNTNYRTLAEKWLNFWSVGDGGARVTYTPGGLAWLDSGGWGNLRYAMNTAFCALVYADKVRDIGTRYRDFATAQVNYALGTNPSQRSYVCGFGNNPPVNPHHRGAHGAWSNSISNPTQTRHILYGALVGGPGATDNYADTRGDYVQNEVATDYNAGFTGALARLWELYGGYTQPDFPVAETPEPQFFVEASINQTGPRFTEIRALLNNRSAWPARSSSSLTYRYFVDLTELYAAGGNASQLTISANMLSGATLGTLQPWDAARHLFYLEINYLGTAIYPGGSTSYVREAQFRITLPNTLPTTAWDPANDYSYTGLASGGASVARSAKLPVYENGILLEGTAPPLASPYSQWRTQQFTATQLAQPSISGDNADPDADGQSNLLEYATLQSPFAYMPAPLGIKGGEILLRQNPAATDIEWIFEESTNMAANSWQTISLAITSTENLGNNTHQLVHRAWPTPAPGQPRKFLRARARLKI